ncbi:hypothetical protein GC173_04590 [bacterium]|nr:hypothetical protein [bacterium]
MTGSDRHSSLYLALRPALVEGRRLQAKGQSIRLGALIAALGPSALPLVAFLVAIPFIWPLSLGPVTTPASLLILLIGFSMTKRQREFPIGEKYLALPLPGWMFRFMRRVLVVTVRRLGFRRLSDELTPTHVPEVWRPRCAWGVVAAALLLLVPIPLLPLTNTFPAIAVMAFTVGYMGGSRSKFQLGVAMCTLGVTMFALYAGIVFFVGWEALGLLGIHWGNATGIDTQ